MTRDDLAALVKSARRTNAVRNVWLGALRTFADLRQFQHAVVSAAHTLPAGRWFSFWNTHKINSKLKFQFVQFSPRGRFNSSLPRFFGPCRLSLQPAAIRLAQRMLRKLKENIFPRKRRQVHAIVVHGHRLLAFQAANAASNSSKSTCARTFSGSGRTRIPAQRAVHLGPKGRRPIFQFQHRIQPALPLGSTRRARPNPVRPATIHRAKINCVSPNGED